MTMAIERQAEPLPDETAERTLQQAPERQRRPGTPTPARTLAGTRLVAAVAATGGMSGVVTIASTGGGLSGVNVQVYDAAGNYVTSASTAAGSGAWSVPTGLATGTYYARTFNFEGYINEAFNDVQCLGCNATLGNPITVSNGAVSAGINFALAPGGRFSGSIVAAQGGGIPGAYVDVYSESGSYVGYGSTNASGLLISEGGFPTGTYYARTQNTAGYINKLYNDVECVSCSATSGAPIAMTVGSTTSGINFTLNPGGRLSGTVTDATTGLPLSGVEVDVYTSTGAYTGYAFSNSQGVYTSGAGLPSGTYYARTWNSVGYINEVYSNIQCLSCSATSGTPIAVTLGSTTPSIDFALSQGGRVSGTITDAATGLPLKGVEVSVYTSTGSYTGSYGYADGSGAYLTGAGLPSGTYYARTFNSQGYINEAYSDVPCLSCAVTSGTAITVIAGAPTSGVDYALTPGGQITGTITDAATALPLSNVTVRLFTTSGSNVVAGTTDSNGVYRLRGLPTGTYYVGTSNASGYINEFYNNEQCVLTCGATGGTSIAVTSPATNAGIDFALTPGGRISGTITDATTGAPLAGITVNFYSPSGSSLRAPGNFSVTVSTNALGQYTSGAGMPSGNYYVLTSNSSGYINEAYNDVQCMSCSATAGTPIAVTVGATTPGIGFALTPGGRISGTVTDAVTNQPLSGVTVQFYTATGAFAASSFTTPNGAFTSSAGLLGGTYYARTFNSQGYIDEAFADIPCLSCSVTTGTPIAVTLGATASGITFALSPGGRISGVINNSVTGLPLSGVSVQFYSGTGSFVGSTSTNVSGTFTSTAFPGGTYYARTSNSQGYVDELYNDVSCTGSCVVTSGAPIAVTAGSTTGSINFALTPGGRVSGTITDAATGQPVAGIEVDIYTSTGSFATWAISNSTGVFVTGQGTGAGLPSGTYYARTFNSLGYINEVYDNVECVSCSTTSGTQITVTLGATTSGINFAMSPGGRISGAVTDAVSGLALSGVTVRIYNASGSNISSATTNALGIYTTGAGLPSATYYAVTSNSLGYINEAYNDIRCVNCSATAGAPITVTAGTTTNSINFALSLGGRITGMVTDAVTGLPLSGVTVQFYNGTGSFVTSTSTGTSGAYAFTAGLPGGEYYARTFNTRGYINEAYNDVQCLSCAGTSGTPIVVTVGSTTPGINFALTQGGRVSGTITNATTGLPLSGIEVDLYTSGGLYTGSYAFSGSTGTYLAGAGLPAGTYYARTFNSLGYINEAYDNVSCLTTCSVTSGTPITVTGGATTNGINFALMRRATINSFTASNVLVNPLAPSTLAWSAAEGASLTLNGAAVSGPTGSLLVNPGATTSYTLVATDGTWTASRTVTVYVNEGTGGLATPSVTAPTAGQTVVVTGVGFTWTGVGGATGYDIRVFDGTAGTLLFSGSLLGAGSTSTLISLPAGSYRFAVRACSGGVASSQCGSYGMVSFSVSPAAPSGAPTVSFPTQGANLTASTQTLSWTAVTPNPDLSGLTYEVLLRDLAAGTTALQITVPSPSLSTIFTMRSSTQYELKVRACQAGCGPWSTAVTFSVTLTTVPTAAPSISACSVSGSNSMTCNWGAVPGADAYQVQVVQAPPAGPGGGALTVAAMQVSATTVTLPVPPGTSVVFIAACNGDGCGPNATTQVVVAGANPSVPNIGTPMAGTVVSGPGVLFTWNRVPGDNGTNTSYRLFVQDLSRQATALDVVTKNNFHSAYFKAEGARYDALVVANPGLPSQVTGPSQGFNVAGASATAPTMVSPSHNGTVRAGNIQLGWSPIPGATLYEYFVAVLGEGSASARGVTPGLLVQVPLSGSTAGTVYSGIVRACPAGATCVSGSDSGWGPWSNAAGGPGVTNFTVIP